MSTKSQVPLVNGASGAAMAFVTVVVLVTVIIFAVRFLVPAAPPIDADRAAERYKAFADMHAAEETALNTPAWVDQDRQIVRLPIDVAVQITARDWQNPETARAALIARGVKATAPLPKTAPKPSAFE
jgi:hypothetical protein